MDKLVYDATSMFAREIAWTEITISTCFWCDDISSLIKIENQHYAYGLSRTKIVLLQL